MTVLGSVSLMQSLTLKTLCSVMMFTNNYPKSSLVYSVVHFALILTHKPLEEETNRY